MGRKSQTAVQPGSRGIAERNVETHSQVFKLFPMVPVPVSAPFSCPDAPDVELDVRTLRKALFFYIPDFPNKKNVNIMTG